MEINFKAVDFIYNNKTSKKKKAIDNLSLNIKDNSISAVCGKNGSGKTTLGYMIDGLLLPTFGEVNVGEFTLRKKECKGDILKLRFEVGITFENPDYQFFTQTVYDEIAFAMKQFNYKLNKIDKHISEALLMVGLDDSYLNMNPYQLSSGEKKALTLASILAFNPKVIVVDDLTINLDDNRKRSLIKLLKLLKNRYKKTIIILGNDVSFINEIADYIYVLDDGKLVIEGTRKSVFNSKQYKALNLEIPAVIKFQQIVKEKKKINMLYRDNINDLMKEVYRHVR